MKKGFTLIELLAVILILGIIALIATPVVNNIIANAKERAEIRSVEGYAQALENAYYTGMLKEADVDISALIPEYKGSKVNCQTKEIINEKLKLTNCSVNGSDRLYNYNNDIVEKSNEEYVEPADNELVDSTTPVFTIKRDYGDTQKVSIRYPEGYTNEYSLDNGKTWHTYTKPLTISKDDNLSARTSRNNAAVGTNNYSAATKSTCIYGIGTKFEYTYQGEEQIFTATCPGTYKIEVWGASGNIKDISTSTNGYGGYSKGEISLTKSQKLYINVGGVGKDAIGISSSYTLANGGYNGGGAGRDYIDGRGAGSGGGATHVAFTSGLLNTLNNSINNIIIVAGGGGGLGNYTGKYSGITMIAGSGGGISGGTGKTKNNDGNYSFEYWIGTGGTQTAGGEINYFHSLHSGTNGTFGSGGNCISSPQGNCSGGGGGFYGGASNTNYSGAGGGGSGYIGNSLLKNKVMYCYNCAESNDVSTKTIKTTDISENATSNYAKIGNGYTTITYLGN